jgi:hypothetical protein
MAPELCPEGEVGRQRSQTKKKGGASRRQNHQNAKARESKLSDVSCRKQAIQEFRNVRGQAGCRKVWSWRVSRG